MRNSSRESGKFPLFSVAQLPLPPLAGELGKTLILGQSLKLFQGVLELPFEALAEIRNEDPFEDAYLFGARLRVVVRSGANANAEQTLSRLGRPVAAEPCLEDVFVSIARVHADKLERVRT